MRNSRRRGLSLAVTLVVLLVLSVLAVSLGAMGSQNLRQIRQSGEQSALLHAANGGLHELMDRLYNQPTYGNGVTDNSCDGSGTYMTSAGPAFYWWTFNRSGPAAYCYNNLGSATQQTGWSNKVVPPLTCYLVVSADLVPKELSREPLRLAAIASKKFRFAVGTDGTLNARNIRGVSGFPGSVWSNATGTGNLISATSIDGQVFTTGDASNILVNGSPTGIPYYDNARNPMPNIPVDQVVRSHDPASSTHPYGGPATYYSTGGLEIETSNSGAVTVRSGTLRRTSDDAVVTTVAPPASGDPEISFFIDGDLDTQGGATLAPRMHFFVEDDMTVGGSLSQLPVSGVEDNFLFVGGDLTFNGGQASNLNLFVGGDARQNGSSTYNGVIYIQDGDFRISGGGTGSNYTGAVLVRGGTINNGDLDANSANFTYNPDYLVAMERYNFSISENTPVYALSWFILK